MRNVTEFLTNQSKLFSSRTSIHNIMEGLQLAFTLLLLGINGSPVLDQATTPYPMPSGIFRVVSLRILTESPF